MLRSVVILSLTAMASADNSALVRLPYNNPGLTVDLGVGLWAQPLPMDYDGDGDMDLLVATADKPSNGVYFFENAAGPGEKFPIFKPGVRLDSAMHNITVSYSAPDPLILAADGDDTANAYPKFKTSQFKDPVPVGFKAAFHLGRDKQWKKMDYDGDGVLDLIVGASDWRDYGWDRGFNERGEWTRGPLHGYVYVIKNTGTNEAPAYADAVQVQAGGKPVDVFGCPSPNFADWDGDGDLDLICGEFLDKITYFQNTGTRTEPVYAEGVRLKNNGAVIAMDLEMIQVVAVDWDTDGDQDLVVGQEDGRVALLECTGYAQNQPSFLLPRFFQQEADCLKAGALSAPFAFDGDGDGDEDLLSGDTAGYINFIENLDGGDPPQWAAPVHLTVKNQIIRIQAGPNGSVQGPAEAKWGYTVLNAADWDRDGLPDLIVNSIWGEVLWFRNAGTRTAPELDEAQRITVAWDGPAPKPAWNWWNPNGNQLVTQWRTSPVVFDWDGNGTLDLIMLDQEGYLAFFSAPEGKGAPILAAPQRIFLDESGAPLRLNPGEGGKSGRRKFCIADWDGDGRNDILIDSKCVDFLRNVSDADGKTTFKNMGMVDTRVLAGHDTCPTVVDWDKNGIPDLVIGAEDGFFYYLKNPKQPAPKPTPETAPKPAETAPTPETATMPAVAPATPAPNPAKDNTGPVGT